MKLPSSIDFHKATKEFPLARATKTKLQIVLSKLSKAEIKKVIKTLQNMEYDCLGGEAKIKWERIGRHIKDKKTERKVFEVIKPELRDDFKMAVWCKFCREFAEKYLYSLEKQKKI